MAALLVGHDASSIAPSSRLALTTSPPRHGRCRLWVQTLAFVRSGQTLGAQPHVGHRRMPVAFVIDSAQRRPNWKAEPFLADPQRADSEIDRPKRREDLIELDLPLELRPARGVEAIVLEAAMGAG